MSLNDRFKLLQQHNDTFTVISKIGELNGFDENKILKQCEDLQITLTDGKSSDIDGVSIFEEIKSLKCFLNNNMTPLDVLNFIYQNDLLDSFPNISIALRIYLSLPVTVASAERSFSKLKRVKNYLRSTMCQERLSNLTIVSIEHEILNSIDISDIINKFASLKARKVTF